MSALYKGKNNPEETSMHRNTLPDSLEEKPITLGVWLLGGAIIALLIALLL